MPCAGIAIAPPLSATRRRLRPATASASRSRKENWTAKSAAPMDPTIKDFESASAELEAIVKKMEDGDLTLEKALELYERGVQLSRFCHSRLEEAERRLEILNERGELRPAHAAMGLTPSGEGGKGS